MSGLVKNGENPVKVGLVVTGDNVKMYGLATKSHGPGAFSLGALFGKYVW